MKSLLIENLQILENKNKIKEIDLVTAYDFSPLETETINYILTLDFQEILFQILCFNISIIQKRDMFLPIYFINEIWVVLKIEKLNLDNPFESEVAIHKTNIEIEKFNYNHQKLAIKDFLINSNKGEFLGFPMDN